jgi:lysine 2,3-aminomutase
MEESVSSKITPNQSLELIDSGEEPPPSSKQSQQFKNQFYPEISIQEWQSWQWQVRNSITTYKELSRIFGPNGYEVSEDINLPLRITPYYASIVKDPHGPIGKCVIPRKEELIVSDYEEEDPLHEDNSSPVPGIIHRYPDRVLFLVTDFCSSNCRYCTRSRIISKNDINRKIWDNAIEYIRKHEEVRDVLLSGGDPLLLNDDSIEYLLNSLRSIEHIEILRIGTKVPVVLPMRITDKLVNMLKKFHPLYLSIHFTHPDELTSEVKDACEKLANGGIPLGSQTVLLKGVNDDIDTMKRLMHGLLRVRVRPYYIYKCDRTLGTSHFQVPISKGLEIMNELIGHTSGYAVPNFILDSPFGKIRLLPENVKRENNVYTIKSFKGNTFVYEDVE